MTQTELEIIDAACGLAAAWKATESAPDEISFDDIKQRSCLGY